MTYSPCVTQGLKLAARTDHMLAYHVSDCVVLAGQPEPETWAELAACGFSTVINIRSDPARAAAQAKKAKLILA